MIREDVIIVEDDELFLKNLSKLLVLEGFSVRSCASADDFLSQLSHAAFRVAIVDLGLPDGSGYDLVDQLRHHTDTGIIILTARSGIESKVKGYDRGADAYFVKPVDSRELVAAIRSLMGRMKGCSPAAPGKPIWHLNTKKRVLCCPKVEEIQLTNKEFFFLDMLQQAHDQTANREEILSALGYNTEGPYGRRALDVMLVRLRKKIKEATGDEAPIATVHSLGYAFSETLARDDETG